ncbi:Predicted membrane protein [Plasmopara halstedii]|uniref:Predicted membrane protein n=1 Tax=Plasmopara halstedii TaxID=4781 RepID=A0A0P1AS75_PLAHL|nr:Predicted membrane protein [Plasmopara halstedii]CEG44120.1 Predicted membrane protein [Plasmopara halstedii]|eukprot:XP_024580489.1 Predicted membrane protein [Plasmopara halstedii]
MLCTLVSSALIRNNNLLTTLRRTRTIPLKFHAKDAQRNAAVILHFRNLELQREQCIYERSNANVLNYWNSAAVAISGFGALGLLEKQHLTTCASSNEDDEDTVERTKKKLKELSIVAIAQLAAFLSENNNERKRVEEFLVAGKGGQIAWGFCMGTFIGFALKKVSKIGAVAIISLFMLLQYANYSGYFSVNCKKLERDVKKLFDLAKNGVVDTKDYKLAMRASESGLPAISGFAAGFIVGFRTG